MQKIFLNAFREICNISFSKQFPNFEPLADKIFRRRDFKYFLPEKGMFGFVRKERDDLYFVVIFRPYPKSDGFDVAVGWNINACVPDIPVWVVHYDLRGAPGRNDQLLALDQPVQLARPWYLLESYEKYLADGRVF